MSDRPKAGDTFVSLYEGPEHVPPQATGGLAGSHSTMIECMNHLASLNLLTEAELFQVGFVNPLKLLGRAADSLNDVPGPKVEFKAGRFVVKPD